MRYISNICKSVNVEDEIHGHERRRNCFSISGTWNDEMDRVRKRTMLLRHLGTDRRIYRPLIGIDVFVEWFNGKLFVDDIWLMAITYKLSRTV